jgi:hypothetical protein
VARVPAVAAAAARWDVGADSGLDFFDEYGPGTAAAEHSDFGRNLHLVQSCREQGSAARTVSRNSLRLSPPAPGAGLKI